MKKQILIPVCIVTVLSWIFALYFTELRVNEVVQSEIDTVTRLNEEKLELSINALENQFYAILDQVSRRALGESAVVSGLPEIARAYDLAFAGNLNDENSPESQEAREALRAYIEAPYQQITNVLGLKEYRLHFHLPPARSLVRSWRKGWQTKRNGVKVDLSDDLSSFRSTVLQVNSSKKPVSGIEVGRGGFVVRGISPVVSPSGMHLGSVEAYYSFQAVIDGLKVPKGVEFGVLMKSELLNVAKSLSDRQANPLFGSSFVVTAASNQKLLLSLKAEDLAKKGLSQKATKDIENFRIVGIPIFDYAKAPVGVMLFILDLSEYFAEKAQILEQGEDTIGSIRIQLLVLAALALLAIFGMLIFIVQRVVGRLDNFVQHAEIVATGDLSKSVAVDGNNELKRLGTALNKLTLSTRDVISKTQGSTKLLMSESERLAKDSHHLQGAAESTFANANNVSAAAEEISASVHHLSSATEELSASIRDIAQSTNESANVANSAFDVATGAVETIERLGSRSEEIGGVMKVITTIAEQTNLLALNATIEAARAGEAGKGFAVVATEVKELAQQTAKATEQISEQIEAIQTDTSQSVQAVRDISDIIENIRANAQTVAAAIEEQSATTDEISHGVVEVTTGSDEIAANISSVSESAQTTQEASLETKNLADELSTIAEQLEKIVSYFKV